MLELIKYIVGQFAEDKENVEYIVEEKERVIACGFRALSGEEVDL